MTARDFEIRISLKHGFHSNTQTLEHLRKKFIYLSDGKGQDSPPGKMDVCVYIPGEGSRVNCHHIYDLYICIFTYYLYLQTCDTVFLVAHDM